MPDNDAQTPKLSPETRLSPLVTQKTALSGKIHEVRSFPSIILAGNMLCFSTPMPTKAKRETFIPDEQLWAYMAVLVFS